jgi:predicted transcriptional regulator
MKTRTLTVRLDPELDRELDEMSKATGRSRGEFVRDALKRQLTLVRFERLRSRTLPFAEAVGLLTDEDVFKLIS